MMKDPIDVGFRDITVVPKAGKGGMKDSTLWTTERIRYADLGRLHLRAVEATLSPALSSREIMNAVTQGFTSQGLRVTQRDDAQGRITAQRIEAPYLVSFSGRRSRSGMEKAEWRVVVASLGVSKSLGSWGGLERVLLLEFMTDPCPKQDLAVRSAAAVASFTEWASKGISRSKDASAGGSPSALMIARQRSSQRADTLLEAVAAELSRLRCAASPGGSAMDGFEVFAAVPVHQRGQRNEAQDHLPGAEDSAVADIELLPWSRKAGIVRKMKGVDAPASERNGTQDSPERSEAAVEVPICLQFVEGLCARAVELCRKDALETWKPLETAVRQLERGNEQLRDLLEPKYRALGASPPPPPRWPNKRGLGVTGPSTASAATNLVLALVRLTPLFVVEESWVIAKVLPRVSTSGEAVQGPVEQGNGGAGQPKQHAERSSSTAFRGRDDSGDAVGATISPRTVRAVVRALGDVLSRLCEAREEEVLKEAMAGSQAYVTELEAYRVALVRGEALRAAPHRSPDGGEEDLGEVDDELWKLFGAMETRLYSSPAALGKKPGRIFVSCSTLWFHSKVMGFESRHVLPLNEVATVSILGTALDLSSSVVITTKDGTDIMLVFPGTRIAALEPVALLIRELAANAVSDGSEGR